MAVREAHPLAEVVGPDGILSGDACSDYRVAGLAPRIVVRPSDREELTAVVRLAEERSWVVCARGGGTLDGAGNPPERLDVVLDTGALNGVVDYQPDDLTVTVEPGITLDALDAVLAERGQFLPLNPPLPSRATAGGTVAAGLTGPWRTGYGGPRDWLIGCRVVGAGGREIRGGGQVVKNVAGYDLPRLYTGSWGDLGIFCELTFKLTPRPRATGCSVLRATSPGMVEELLAEALASPLEPKVLDLTDDPAVTAVGRPWALFFEFHHVPEAVAWQQAEVAALAARHGAEYAEPGQEAAARIIHGLRDHPARAPMLCRVAAKSSDVALIAHETRELCGAEGRIIGRGLAGEVLVTASGDHPPRLGRELREVCERRGARASFLRMPEQWRGELAPWPERGDGDRLVIALKRALDPARVFGGGRFLGDSR